MYANCSTLIETGILWHPGYSSVSAMWEGVSPLDKKYDDKLCINDLD